MGVNSGVEFSKLLVNEKQRGSQRAITSREYKLMLNPLALLNRAEDPQKLWKLIKFMVEREKNGVITKEQNKVKVRKTRYVDTKDFKFRKHGVALRHREETRKNGKIKHKVALKYRGLDRYLASDIDISDVDDVKTKFEEDVLARSRKYSLSGSFETKKEPDLGTFGEVVDRLPVLAKLQLPADEALESVNGFCAHEEALWLGQARFDNGHTVKFCLNYWYLNDKADNLPLVAEVSFDYDLIEPKDEADEVFWPTNRLEQFHIPTVLGVQRVFQALQRQTNWVNPTGTTKTAYAYEDKG